ncbi:Alpha/Beta hydrolase protein [Mycena olivaceomarginata]|nr:Alpha/Beta hydrolase protein [Mycena olivaceomarginata]
MLSLHCLTRYCAAILLTSPLARGQATPIIDLGYAQYQGAVDTLSNITQFLGIRYAAPPIGDLRFRAPHAPPNECVQGLTGKAPANPLEARATEIDRRLGGLLFLNVYYPSDGTGVPPVDLPTVVFIHGGGEFNGEDLIRQSNRGIVVVLIQYRLGIFGFLAGSAVKKNGALNAGFARYSFLAEISKFGGDPSKVTIWGQSAGAGSVLQHVVANGEPAITSSTFLPSQYHFDDRVPELLFGEVLAQTNCQQATDSMASVNTNITSKHLTLSNQKVAVTASQYSLDLFPGFGTAQADAVGSLYADLAATCSKSMLSRGMAFRERAFKAEFAILPGLHANDIAFIDAFAQSFTSFIINLDPNLKGDPSTITPQWNMFEIGHTEMLFNKTADGVPVVQPITTSDCTVESVPLCSVSFWNSVGNLTAQ